MKCSNTIHNDLLVAQQYVYEPNELHCSVMVPDAESQEYGACTFEMNNKCIVFRAAKITPTKNGQFVTLWKRIGNGPIMPCDRADPVDFFVVSVRNAQQLGQFIFPKELLCKQGFVSKEGKGGKRAMRVYPPWDIADSVQAKKTQAWQLLYFVNIQPVGDMTKIEQLFASPKA